MTGSPTVRRFLERLDARGVDAVLLDLDDTLYSLRPLQDEAALRLGVGRARFRAVQEQWFAGYLRGELTLDEYLFGRWRALGLDPATAQSVYSGITNGSTQPAEGAVELLTRLDVPTCVVTTGNPFNQLAKLRSSGLAAMVDDVVISELVGLRKPDPRIFRLAAARLGTVPERCLMVGDDRLADVDGALGAGCAGAVWVHANPRRGVAPPRLRDGGRVLEVASLADLAAALRATPLRSRQARGRALGG